MIAVVDYGVGNLRSVAKALEALGADVRVSGDAADLVRADRIVLPGVGAFGECISRLKRSGLIETLTREVTERGKPILGICVGMQILADTGYEKGIHWGLGWIHGEVKRFEATGRLKVPHVGWNDVVAVPSATLFSNLGTPPTFYFVHSYFFEAADDRDVAARSVYGHGFSSALQVGNIAAVQFHPEKSQTAGLALLQNYMAWNP